MGFSASQLRTVRALGDTLIPPRGEGAELSGGAVLVDALPAFAGHLAVEKQKGLAVALTLFEVGGWIFFWFSRFTRMGTDRRARYLASWMNSRLGFRRIVYRALRDTCMLLYYQDPRSWPGLGYAGPPLEREGSPGGRREPHGQRPAGPEQPADGEPAAGEGGA